MQTLNTLSTPEEKLAALCKKYAELVSPCPFLLSYPPSLWKVIRLPGVGARVQEHILA
jgi:hypothetical protein